jgi:hypothetical protein
MMLVSIPVMLFAPLLDGPKEFVPYGLAPPPFPAFPAPVPQLHQGVATPSGVGAGENGSLPWPRAERIPLPLSSDEKSTAGPSPGHCVGVIVRVISREGWSPPHHARKTGCLGLQR